MKMKIGSLEEIASEARVSSKSKDLKNSKSLRSQVEDEIKKHQEKFDKEIQKRDSKIEDLWS